MRRHIVLTILMVVIGAILLLPGVCAILFIASTGVPIGNGDGSLLIPLWTASFLISAGGIWLIVKAFR